MVQEVINPAGLTEADLAVVIVSRGDSPQIVLPTTKVSIGLAKFYPDLRSAIIHCGGASRSDLREAFFAVESEIPRIHLPFPPEAGRGVVLHHALNLAAELRARALAVINADLLSIKTTWMPSLFGPLLHQGAEYVAPLYVQDKNEAPITRWLAYPLLRALLGRRVLQPIETDHAFSSRLIEVYRAAGFDRDDAAYRSDLKLLSLAVMNQARICQSFMAHPRVCARGAAIEDELPGAFAEAARALFALMAETRDFWPAIARSRPTALAGVDEETKNPPPQVILDPSRLRDLFLDLGRKCRAAWADCLSPPLASAMERALAAAAAGETPEVTVDLWRASLYAASACYGRPSAGVDAAAALAPVFLGRCLAALATDQGLTARQLTAQAEETALNFEKAKPDLVSLWGA